MAETVLNLNESDILGYFETIECNFHTKLLLLFNSLDKNKRIIKSFIKDESKQIIIETFDGRMTMAAIDRGNSEPVQNFIEDALNTIILQSWCILELVCKDLIKPSYALLTEDQSCNYKAGFFGFSKDEKDDLDLFYYMRNALVHYNGAFYSSKTIDHSFNGVLFKSDGNGGFKGDLNLVTAFKISRRIQELTLKAWTNHTNRFQRQFS